MKFSMIYGTAWKKEQTESLVNLALEKGFVAIDTANQPKHYNEPAVGQSFGKWLQLGHSREKLFIQTKFTPVDGQDHRTPYNRNSSITEQVKQSIESSLQNLNVDYVDSYLLHGPYNHPRLGDEDWEVWSAIEQVYKNGQTKQIGISNVSHSQLAQLIERATVKPTVVQNRCFAQTGWDFHVRKLCAEHGIMYQGFSLLTANPFVMEFAEVSEMAKNYQATPAQIVFAFSRELGMMPLTGTTNPEHMSQDLKSSELTLTSSEVEFILKCALNL